jgi:hypothetical protein
MGSLARIFGPVFAASLLDVHPALPYLICGGVSLLTAAFAWQYLHRAAPPAAGVVATPPSPSA